MTLEAKPPADVVVDASVERLTYEAIQLHVEGLIEDKQPVPIWTSFAEYVVVPA